MSSKDNGEECVMHSMSRNIEIMLYDKLDEVLEELFQSLLFRYQIGYQWKVVILTLFVFIYCITNVVK